MRTKMVAANWKMNTDQQTGNALLESVVQALDQDAVPDGIEVVIVPPFTFLPIAARRLEGTALRLGAQNLSAERDGAFTGEISGAMLKSVGCSHVIVGHSERRTLYAESDILVRNKVNAAFDAGLIPIICVGETAAERQEGRVEEVLDRQVRTALQRTITLTVPEFVIAYEPVWAIGTGQNATPEQAQEAHAYIRSILSDIYDADASGRIAILYGGSVKAGNAPDIFAERDIDGGLIGGASLSADEFARIVRAASPATARDGR